MTNFDFLVKEELFKEFSNTFVEAEKSLALNNVTTAILSRRALELAIKWIYANDRDLELPYQENLYTLIHNITFTNIIDKNLFIQINYIVKLGNLAVHNNKRITRQEAILSLNYLFNFALWMQYSYGNNYEEYKFDENILPEANNEIIRVKEKEDLFDKLSKKDKKISDLRKQNINEIEKITEKRENNKNNISLNIEKISEYRTRKMFIDVDLKEKGWDFKSNIIEEYPVTGMPSSTGNGRVDYVLFDTNGLPLAVVEAKRTSRDPRVGKEQAKLYADCLEEKFSQRPIIFYTNGFETYMWDDKNYSPRKVSGFYTQDELHLLITRRKTKESLEHIFINEEITNRIYQHEAIKSVCEVFEQGYRKALLVMATGTGKTRTAISLVDVLTQKNWVKNILFLADRKVLVKQAESNFKKLLPNISSCNLLNSQDSPENSRIVFSTYQTMINEIDNRKNKNGISIFTPGHFDLIIIDEAHRSIYNKYMAIFEYFDSLLIGLTATPRNDVDKNTYRFFEIENDVPTYTYEMDEAVKEGYLVDYKTIKTNTVFTRDGIKYNNLPEEEKEEYENLFEEDEFEEEISNTALNTWLFNKDTIRKHLKLLMDKGLKVEGGDKLGKTIIFAKNHKHAFEIVKIFNKLYPHYKDEFAKIIDNQMEYNESTLADFSNPLKMPQIAVSVDMLDTGVDVPEVVNLVFYKPVKSRIKFWQMIGRGTRLCKDLYGEGKDKKEFYIFDYCSNFDFFSENPKGIEVGNTVSLLERIFKNKLDIILELQNLKYQENKEYISYRQELVNEFLNCIAQINPEGFIGKSKKQYIFKYNKKEIWNNLSVSDVNDIKTHLIPLFISLEEDEYAKLFDGIMYVLESKNLQEANVNREVNRVVSLIEKVSKKGTIKEVVEKKDYIKKAMNEEYLKDIDILKLEELRIKLRDLIKFIDFEHKKAMETDFTDIIVDYSEGDSIECNIIDSDSYKKKVNKYLNNNLENIIIFKLRHNKKLNRNEYEQLHKILFKDLGSGNDYTATFGDKNIMEVVRNIVGLDPEVARNEFMKFTNDTRLNRKQIKFVKLIIDYVIKNGTVELEILNEDPFRAIGEIYDIFEDNLPVIEEIVAKVREINDNANKLA